MQHLPGPCSTCGQLIGTALAFSTHQGGLIGHPCLSPKAMRAAGMLCRRGLWFVSAREARRGTFETDIYLSGDAIDFWHYRLIKNPGWDETKWDGTDEHYWDKYLLTWHVVHATVIEVAYYGSMITVEADHPSWGAGWRHYAPAENFDLVRPGETPVLRAERELHYTRL